MRLQQHMGYFIKPFRPEVLLLCPECLGGSQLISKSRRAAGRVGLPPGPCNFPGSAQPGRLEPINCSGPLPASRSFKNARQEAKLSGTWPLCTSLGMARRSPAPLEGQQAEVSPCNRDMELLSGP